MLDLNQVLAFVMVVRHGSFAAAARALEIPRSTVSARVLALEAHLGARLLRRTTRRTALTDDGRAYHASVADAAFALLAANTVGPRARMSGLIRITAPLEYPQAILRRAVLGFVRLHPRVRFDVLLTNRTIDFVADNVDLAIRGGAPGTPGLVSAKLGHVHFGLFASPRYLDARGVPRQLADLASHDVLLLVGRDGRRLLGLPASVASARRSEAPFGSDSMTFLKRLAIAGAGIAVLPLHLCAAKVRAGALVHLLPEWRGEEVSAAFLVFPSHRNIDARVRAFADHLKKVAAPRPARRPQVAPATSKASPTKSRR